MIYTSPIADTYHTDGYWGYADIDFPGFHNRNMRNKNDTYTVEGTNSCIRHCIAGFRRRSKCFFRKFETMRAVLCIFISAFNKFGHAKYLHRLRNPNCGRDFNFNHLQYIRA